MMFSFYLFLGKSNFIVVHNLGNNLTNKLTYEINPINQLTSTSSIASSYPGFLLKSTAMIDIQDWTAEQRV